jgi:nucleotide-binding universal stress UspA family protein
MKIQKILLPVDFSDHSRKALETAAEFAKAFGAKVHLLHCYQVQPVGVSPYGVVIPESFDREVREAASRLSNEWAEKLAADGVEVEVSLSAGFPGLVVSEAAKELGVDLIVMGTRGLTGLKHMVLGSVAERTLRTAPCAVLTVKEPDEE